jgi:hypothetical protein
VTGISAQERRRRIRRNAVVLALTAIYVAFIASGVMKAQP